MKKKKKEKDKDKKRKPFFYQKEKGPIITIKTSLKSILKDYNSNYSIINKLVIDCNDIVIRTYQFIRLYLLDCYHKNKKIPLLDKDNILYFIRAGGIRDNRGRHQINNEFQTELELFYDTEFKECINKEKYNLKNKSYIIPYLAIQIQTGLNNNIKEHFITRIRRFMNIFAPIDLSIDENKKMFNTVKNLILLDMIDEIPDEIKEWSKWIRNNFLPNEYEKSFGYDCKVNPSKYFYYTIKMNEEIEKKNLNCNDKIKLFQPIPLRNSIIPHYITLDASGVLSIFGDDGESHLGYKINENKEKIWNKIFNMKNKILNKKGYEFKTFQTDGVGVSICYQKIGYKIKQDNEFIEWDELYITDLDDEELKECKKRKLVAIDPGKHCLVYMLDEDNNKLRYTACQRRIESYRKKCNMISRWEKLNNNIIEEETKLSNQNCKTIDYNKFKIYIKEKTILNNKVKNFYEQDIHRKFKWRTWIYQRKSEDNFISNIEKTYGKKEDILLCYGNWSNTKQMKYLMPTKGIGMRRAIEKKFDVVLVDEFRTSKLCSCCHGELENYKINKKKLHRLLICRSCKSNGLENKNITFMNRDMNACINIRKISSDWINHKSRNNNFCRNTCIDSSKGEKQCRSIVFT